MHASYLLVDGEKSNAQGGARTLNLEIMRLARHRLRHLGYNRFNANFYQI